MEFYEVSSDFEMRFAKFMLLLLGFQGFLWDLMEVEWNFSGGAKLVLSSGSPTWQSGIIDSTYDLSEILVMLWDFIAFHWCGLVVHIEVMVASAAMATACWATHPTLPWLPLTPQTHQHRDLW